MCGAPRLSSFGKGEAHRGAKDYNRVDKLEDQGQATIKDRMS